MPLLDHFHPPLSSERRWESFHSSWATRLVDDLPERLPSNYIAEENAHFGPSIEIDVATFERGAVATGEDGDGAVTTVDPKVWAPPAADGVLPAVFPDTFEIRFSFKPTGREGANVWAIFSILLLIRVRGSWYVLALS